VALLLAAVGNLTDLSKRLIVGRAMRSDKLGETELPKTIALPIFASDPLSSVAYATQEILLVLALGGLTYLHYAPWLAACVVVLLLVVVFSYRQVVHAYPSGGGSYEVVSRNLGATAGLVVAASLMVDYVMTVAVSVSSGVDNIISAVPSLDGARVAMCILFVAVLTALNLRGLRESGKAFALPTYLFIAGVALMVGVGLFRVANGDSPRAESADYTIRPELHNLSSAAVVFLLLRAFSSGCTALTGVEAISNGVPAFRKPKSKNAATTLLLMGVAAILMFVGITALAIIDKVHVTQNSCDLVGFTDCTGEPQRTVIAQVAAANLGGTHSVLFVFVQAMTAIILILAANTAFNGFPLLASILAQDRYMPRQLHNRGDRLAFSNGIVLLAVVAGLLIFVFDASVSRLIQLYILGVFTSFTLSQAGMVRHWNREIAEHGPTPRVRRSRILNGFGAALTGVVLVIVTITKFEQGAWIVIVAVPLLFMLMRGIHKHYESVSRELAIGDDDQSILPSRVHAIVLVSQLHKPTLRALNYARASRPSTIEALTVSIGPEETQRLSEEWDRRAIPVPLKVLDSPYREITRPIVQYVREARRDSPRDLVTVYIPEYVVGHWWEHLLHNQSALRLKGRLLFTPGVMVVSVPWQLASSEAARLRPEPLAPGAVRRGQTPTAGPRSPEPLSPSAAARAARDAGPAAPGVTPTEGPGAPRTGA
jgi:amino acid transporter